MVYDERIVATADRTVRSGKDHLLVLLVCYSVFCCSVSYVRARFADVTLTMLSCPIIRKLFKWFSSLTIRADPTLRSYTEERGHLELIQGNRQLHPHLGQRTH